MVNRLLTVIFLVDSNPPFEQLGQYTALEAHYKPLLPRQIRPRRRLCASSWCQTMNRGETKNTTWEGPRERSLSAPPQPFSCLTSVQLFAQLHYSCIFLQNTSEKHTIIFCPPCHGPTKRSKVWVQTNIFFSQGSDLISWSDINTFSSISERLDCHSVFWLVITIVHFVFREEIYQHIAWLCRLELLETEVLSLLPRLLYKRRITRSFLQGVLWLAVENN